MSASAATFVYTPEVIAAPTYTQSRIVSGRGGGFIPGASTNTISLTAQTINVDYSSLGDDLLTFTMKAPEGKVFDIQVPTWGTSTLFVASLFGSSIDDGPGMFQQDLLSSGTTVNDSVAGSGFSVLGIDQLSSIRLTGPAIFPGSGLGGDVFEIFSLASLVPGAHYQFSGITWQTTVPASYDHNFSNVSNLDTSASSGIPFVYGYFEARTAGGQGETSTDPGQWFRLIDTQSVPEPSAALLGSLAGLALLRRRR
jgi:hypothetical protein